MSDQPSGWGPPSGQGQNPPPQQFPGPYPPPQYAGPPYPGPPGYPPAPTAPTGPAPLDQPQYDATIGQAVVRFWKKYFVFSGRASRSEYWWWALVAGLVSLVLQTIGSIIFGVGMATRSGVPVLDFRALLPVLIPSLVWALATLIGTLAVAVRRLHDTNRSGWWYLLVLPTYVGLPFYLAGLASIDMTRLSEGDLGGIAFAPLVAGSLLSLLGGVGGIILLVFLILAPNPAGARFDRPSAGTQPLAAG